MRIAKRVIGILLAVAVVLSNIPVSAFAEGEESGGLTDAQIVSADKDWLTFDVIKSNGNTDGEHVVNNLYLPVTGANGSKITWSSSNGSVINVDDVNSGQSIDASVTRPAASDGNKDVTLKANFAKGMESGTKEFSLTVIALESTDLPLSELNVRQDYNWLTYTVILNQNEYNWNPPDVKTDLSLPTQGENGSAISWTTSDENVISPDGIVTRPPSSKADSRNNSYLVTVTAEIANGDYKLEKSLPVYVGCTYPSGEADEVCEYLTIDGLLEYNTQDCVLSNLTLPTDGSYGCAISWASSDESIISVDGTVTQPAYDLTGYRSVTLTATVSKDEEKQTKQFTVRVPCAPSGDAETAAQDDAKMLSDDGEMKSILNGNTSIDTVETNLALPMKGKNGSAISWLSSDPSIIAPDGTVTQSADEGQFVTLTATIANGDAQAKRRIFLYVEPLTGTEDEQAVNWDYGFLDEDSIAYGHVDVDLHHLMNETLWLPQNDDGENPSFSTRKGCAVSWSSSDPSVFEIVKDESSLTGVNGVPHRPPFLEGDKTVTLTATITKGDASRKKSFQITVAAQNPEGAEAVVLDKEWLTDDLILNGNKTDDVKRTLNLPTQGKYGSNISWQSSNASAVDPDTGKVTRPKQDQSDISVTLTANLSIDSNGRASKDTKTFQITVTKKENSYLAVRQDDFSHTDTLQCNGDAKATQFGGKNVLQLSGTKDGAGSVFTKNKIYLGGDGSFSTAFAFRINQANSDGGLTFTLQAKNNTESGGGILGTDGITPSVSVGFYVIARTSDQGGTPLPSNIWLKVFHDGNYDSAVGTSYAKTLFYSPSGVTYHTWIEYDGSKKTMEIRVAEDTQRPEQASAVIENVDINSLLQIGEGQSAGEVYAGFTGADDINKILNWSFQNGSAPIDSGVYDYFDASQVSLAEQSVDQQSFPVEATVLKNDGTAASGVPVTFTTTYGDLDQSSAVTDSSGKASVTLSVKNAGLAQVEAIAAGGATATASISFAFSDSDSVALDGQWLKTADEQTAILNGNSDADHILTDLKLPGTGLNGSKITWASDNAAVDGTTGKVALPTAEQGDQKVTLTAEISKGNAPAEEYSMTVTVKTTDTIKVLADRDALTDDILLNEDGDDDIAHVTKDLTLPKSGKNGSTITWSFSNNYFSQNFKMIQIIDKDGKVTRPPFTEGEKTVTLTAKLTLGSVSVTKDFSVTVLSVPATDQEAADADADALTADGILNGNSCADSVTTNLSLPTNGTNGSTIKWTSSNSLYLAADGAVNRPAYSTGDQSVTLTATLTKGAASTQKKFSLTIKRMDPTNEEILFEGYDWLNESRTLGPDNLSQYAVTSDLTLPDKTANGLSITWKSGAPDIVSDGGAVTRPPVGANDKAVTLTATITGSSGSTTKQLHYTVLAEPDATLPYVTGSSLKVNSQAAYNTQKIILTFSEIIVEKNLKGVKLEGPDIPEFNTMVGRDADGVQDQLVITLSGELDPDSQYTLTVPKDAVADLAGNPMNADYARTFTVEKKTVRTIGIVSTTPADGTADYTGTSSFTVKFDSTYSLDGNLSEGPAFDSVRIVEEGGTEYTAANAIFKVLGNTLYLNLPSGASLKPGYLYQIVIPEGAVQDYYKNTNEAKTVQFSTHYTGSVNVFDVYPSYGKESVDIHQDIFFTVSGGSSLDTSGVTLKDGSGNAVEASVNRFGSNPFDYVVQPVKPLQPSTAYTMVIAKNALALKVNGGTQYMGSDYTLKFTTGGNSLPVQSTGPAALEQQGDVSGEITIKFPSEVRKVETETGIFIQDASGNKVASSASEDGGTVTVDTDSPLKDGEIYTVTLPAGAYESGGKKNDALQFRFLTANAIDADECTFDVDPSNTQMEAEPISFSLDSIENALRLSGYKPSSFNWSFGDGSTSAEESPSHSYAAAGRYSVMLTVKDGKGHSYSWTRGVNILAYSSGQIHLSVTPSTNTALYLTDEGTSADYKEFTVHLTYGDACTALCGKVIQAVLYQNGKFVKNLYTNTTSYGTAAGTMTFRFKYQNYPAGTYELRFVYGTDADNAVASVPVTIYNKRSSQDLRLKFYHSKTGDQIRLTGYLYFLLDGQKVRAQEWWDNSSEYGYLIPSVPLGSHTLKFVSAEETQQPFTHVINPFTVNHTGESNSHPVKLIPLKPGVISVTSEKSDSNNQKDTTFIDGVYTPPFTFTVKGDWNGMSGGTYILKTSGGKILRSEYGEDTGIFYNVIPAYELPVGERLLVGMVTSDGGESAWVDVKVKTIASPFGVLSEDSKIVYEDGEYSIQNTVTIPAVASSASADPDLQENSIPGLGGTSGFMEDWYKTLGGKWDADRIQMDKIKLTYDLNSAYTQNETVKQLESKVMMKALGMDVYVDCSGEYLLNYNSSTNRWEVYYQTFTLKGDITQQVFKESINIPHTPISVASLTVKLGVLIGTTLVYDYSKSDSPSGEIIQIDPHAEGDVQVGLDVANITASLEARLPCELDYPSKYFEIDPNATFKVKAQFLLYSKTLYKKKVQTKWHNDNKKINLMSLALAGGLPTSNDLENSPRGYLTRPFQWLTSAIKPRLLFATAAKAENPSVETLAQNVYPDADVQLVQSDGKLYAIWTDDNPGRSDANRTQLRCSVYEDGAWSAPAWLGTDATGDFSPAAAAVGDGTLIAWQDMKKEMTSDADADEASRNCEISVSENPLTDSNSGSFEAVRLTNDDEFDHSPKIASDGSSAVVTWVKSDGLALDGTATKDSLWFAKWTQNSGWSGAEQLADVGHTVINSTLALHGGKAVLLYTVDTDDNLSTSDDQEIYLVTWDGSSWGTPVRLTDNSVEDSSPQATYANGNWLIVWNQDGQTVYRAGLDSETKTVDAVTGAGNKFQLVSIDGEDPQITLVYYTPGDNGTRGLAESTYDAASGLWGNEKVLTDGSDGYTGSFCPVDTDDGQLKIFYTQADMVTESIDGDDYNSASDKADLELLTYTPVHDLALDSDDGLQLSAETPVAGIRETVTATVENVGDYAENAAVSLYRGDPANGGLKVAQSEAVPVAAHASAQVDIPWQVASDFTGSGSLYAVVSPAEGITDSDESNNTVSRTISTSDLSISGAQGDYIAGNKYKVTAAIQNNGSDTLKNVVLNLTDDESGKTLATETIDELDPGMTGGFDQIVSVDGLTKNSDGNYSVTLKAVLPEGVTDNNPDDNTDSFELEVPSITVNSVTPAPNAEQVELQQPIAVTFNMAVKKGGGFDGVSLKDASLNPVEITTALDGDTLTITPTGDMVKGEKYTLVIPADAVTDDYGHTMAQNYTLGFTTVTSSPAVVFAAPGSEMQNAPKDSDIRLKYNQTVSRGSDFSGITVTDSDSRNVAVSATLSGQWLTLHPSGNLSEATQYTVTVPVGAVKNASGEVQPQAYSYCFTTESEKDASLSNLQALVGTYGAMTQGNYTDASWAAFLTALAQAQAVLDKDSPAQDEVNAAAVALAAAKNALTEKSDHSGSDSDGPKQQTNPAGTPAEQNLNFKSDTTATYRFGQNNIYYYKITTTDTIVPTVVSSNPLVASVELAQKLPDGYLFRVTDVGDGSAVITTTSVTGVQTSFSVLGVAPQGIVSDTPFYHSVKKGDTYQFKFSVPEGSQVPVFTSGNGQIVSPVLLRKDGNTYFFTVRMLTDGSAGIYQTLAGSSPVLRCILSSSG